MESRRRRCPSGWDLIRICPNQIPKRLKLTPCLSRDLEKLTEKQSNRKPKVESRRCKRPSGSDLIRIGPNQIPKRLKLTPCNSPDLEKLPDKQSTTSIDHISSLPDSILQHIFSFLPVEDAVKCRFLSKRWLSVWAEVPVLRFSDHRSRAIWDFPDFVDDILKEYRSKKVEKVEFDIRDNRSISSELDEWIRFATDRYVEELRLNLLGARYTLPQSVYSTASLRRLDTNLCNFDVNGIVSWTSLRVLSISNSKLSDGAMARILSGSPKLEYLKMHSIDGVNTIIDSNSSLKELVIDGWGNSTSVMEISGANINSLTLSGTSGKRIIKAINLSSLVEFDINLWGCGYTSAMRLLAQLHHAERVSVRHSFLEILSMCEMLPLPYPLKCKSLTVTAPVNKGDFRGIANLLQSSPYLEKLTLNLLCFMRLEDLAKHWESMNTNVKCHHLKSVAITGFNQESYSSLVELLLKSAPALEKMVICAQSTIPIRMTHKLPELPDLSEVNKLFSSYPNVTVVFKTYFK